jgi:predicted nuclease of restriction endonuclease-like (RecB) superfamily
MSKEKKPKVVPNSDVSLADYAETLADIKRQIEEARIKAITSASTVMVRLYWSVGKKIVEKQENSGWGANVIEKLAKDIQSAFPAFKGFSRANLFHMRSFYLAYGKSLDPTRQIDSLPFFSLPWWHNVILLMKLKDNEQRLWYAQQTIECGWSQNILEDLIKSDLYSRQGKAITNFQLTLPKPHSDLADQSLKDPYCLDFLEIADGFRERELEQALIDNIQHLLLELGKGFAFVGRQVPLRMDDNTYYVDLLFYHYKLHCFFVVELKNTPFRPEYAGKMAFYLATVDHCLKKEEDNKTIGMILCRSKDKLTVEYALKYNISPIGVSTYETELIEKLPKELKNSLPTIEEIEAELGEISDDTHSDSP